MKCLKQILLPLLLVLGTAAGSSFAAGEKPTTGTWHQDTAFLDLEIAKSIKAGDCGKALRLLNREGSGERFYQRTKAIMMAEGLCLERDIAQAAAVFKDWLATFPHDRIALARLGSLYWQGDAVAKNQEQAKQLFKRAAAAMGADLMGTFPQSWGEHEQRLAEVWETSPRDMLSGFMDGHTGPWPLPGPLQDDASRLSQIIDDARPEIVKIALHLREGTGGFEKDEALAFRWLFNAAVVREIPGAFFPLGHWLWKTRMCEETWFPLEGCEAAYSLSESMFLQAAAHGDSRATAIIGPCVLRSEEFPRREYAIYYWLLRMKREGLDVEQEQLEKARNDVPENDRRIVEEWHFDPGRGLPFTRLDLDKC